MSKPGLSLSIFVHFTKQIQVYSTNMTINEKSIDGGLGPL